MLRYILAFLFLTGCYSMPDLLLSPAQVKSATIAYEGTPLNRDIGELWAAVEKERQTLTDGLVAGYLDKPTFLALYYQLATADYYMGKAWSLMIEGQKAAAVEALNAGEKELVILRNDILAVVTKLRGRGVWWHEEQSQSHKETRQPF